MQGVPLEMELVGVDSHRLDVQRPGRHCTLVRLDRLGVAQLANSLFGAVSLALLRESPSGPEGPSGLSLNPDQFFGGRSG